MISYIELLKLLNNKPNLDLKMIKESYMELIYTIVFNKISIKSSKEDIEKCVRDVFFEVFDYKNRIDSQKGFTKVFLTSIAKRKIMNMYRRNKNNNLIHIDNVSMHLNNIADDVVHSFLLKESNSQLIDDIKSLSEPDREIITRNYYLNQSVKDISKNIGLKFSTYA